MDIFADSIADRLGGRDFGRIDTEYKFAAIKKAKQEAMAANPDKPIIDMGVGEPDKPADSGVVEILAREAGKPENRHYSDNGIFEFQEAAAGYLEKVYGLKNIDPFENILHGIGSKPVYAMLPMAFINPGDVTLATVPGYPVMSTYTRYMGGEVYNIPLHERNGFFPDFSSIPREVLKKAKLLYINYPNNPTGQSATMDFFRETAEFAIKNRIIVVSDAAYSALTYDGCRPLSFFSVQGAWDVGLEVYSLSKAFNMTGWRMAFITGNKRAIKAYGAVKDNTDSGQFRAIQKAGIYALNHTEITEENCRRYSRRLELMVKTLNESGFKVEKPKASFYCYVRSPIGTSNGLRFGSAGQAAEFLIRKALISVVPWDDAGAYLRFSATFEADDVEEEIKVMEELKIRLKSLELIFD